MVGAPQGIKCGSVETAAGLRERLAVSHISRKTSEMWGTRRLVAGREPKRVIPTVKTYFSVDGAS